MKILIGSTVAETHDNTGVIIKTGVLAGYSKESRTSLAIKQAEDLALAKRDSVSKTNSEHINKWSS